MTTITASWPTRLGIAAIGLLICAPGIDALLSGQSQGLIFVVFGVVLAAVPNVRYTVSWDDRGLVYRGFIKTQRMQFADIRAFAFSGPRDDRFAPTLGLRIIPRAASDPTLTINVKPFARRDIALLTERLEHAIAAGPHGVDE